MIIEKAPILIIPRLHFGSKDGIAHVNYASVTLFHLVVDMLCL